MNIIVLGFDGMEPSKVRQMISNGQLPNIASVRQQGVESKMESTLIPISAMAWSSFLTGVNPGKHGIYDFVTKDNSGENSFSIATSEDRQSAEIWQYLSEKNYSAGVVGMPLTYPVDNGADVMISGYPTPKEDGSFTPQNLTERLPHHPTDIHQDVHYSGSNKKEFIRDQNEKFDAVRDIHEYIMKNDDLDVQITVFKQTDDIAHVAWDEDPLHDIYRRADAVVGDTVDYIDSQDEEYTLMLMSDHGFGYIDGTLFLNNLLHKTGHLDFKDTIASSIRSRLSAAGFNQLNILKLLKKIGLGEQIVSVGTNSGSSKIKDAVEYVRNRVMLGPDDIDYEASTCYSRGNYGQIFNTGESEELTEVVNDLQNATVQGEKIIDNVYRTDEHFHGNALDTAPELLIETKGYDYLSARKFELASDEILTDHVLGRTAEHKPVGVFAAYGDGVPDSTQESISLEDFLPTIFNTLGAPVPQYVDGDVISGFESDISPEEYTTIDSIDQRSEISESDKEQIEKKLEGLGYKT